MPTTDIYAKLRSATGEKLLDANLVEETSAQQFSTGAERAKLQSISMGINLFKVTGAYTVTPVVFDSVTGKVPLGLRDDGSLFATFSRQDTGLKDVARLGLGERLGQMVEIKGTPPIWPILFDNVTGKIPVGVRPDGTIAATFSRQDTGLKDVARLGVGESLGQVFQYKGSFAVWPILWDTGTGKVVVGVDPATGKLLAQMDEKQSGFAEPVKKVIAPQYSQFYRVKGGRYAMPQFDDLSGQLMLGFDNEKLRPAGALAAPTTRAASALLPGAATPVLADWNGFGVFGQSLGAGADAVPAITTSQPFSNISFAGAPRSGAELGGSTSSVGPLIEVTVGSDGESICSGASNRAVELAYTEAGRLPSDFVIFAFNGARSSQTVEALSKGHSSGYYAAFIAQVQQAKSLANAAGKSFAVHAIAWMQGEANVGSTFAAYYAALKQLRLDLDADIRAVTGQAHPVAMFLYQTASGSRWSAFSAADVAADKAVAVQRAQLALCRNEPNFYFVAPVWNMPAASNNAFVHISAAGERWISAYFGRAYKALVIDKAKPQSLMPMGAVSRTIDGITTVRVKFDVPARPLVIDRVNLPPITNNGFALADDAGLKTIKSMRISHAGDEIVLTFDGAWGSNPMVRCGADYVPAGTVKSNTCASNLRDSTPDTDIVAGSEVPLWHLAPHFILPVYPLV